MSNFFLGYIFFDTKIHVENLTDQIALTDQIEFIRYTKDLLRFIRQICLQIAISSECQDEIHISCFRIRSCAMKPTEDMYRAIL